MERAAKEAAMAAGVMDRSRFLKCFEDIASRFTDFPSPMAAWQEPPEMDFELRSISPISTSGA